MLLSRSTAARAFLPARHKSSILVVLLGLLAVLPLAAPAQAAEPMVAAVGDMGCAPNDPGYNGVAESACATAQGTGKNAVGLNTCVVAHARAPAPCPRVRLL